MPSGKVDAGETIFEAAYRECLEEAGIKIKLLGILSIEHKIYPSSEPKRMKNPAKLIVTYFSEPQDPDQIPKQIPDEES